MSVRACARCGTMNRVAARFCDECGQALAEQDGTQRFADDELKHATVLFSDIVGSTEMIAKLPPDDARLRFTPALGAMAEAVHLFGGTVNQMLGDGIMALFGAPASQEDHAVRACGAALRMHELAAQIGVPVRLRIGIASGQMLLSAGGFGASGAFFAFGGTTHLAARLQGVAEPGTTVCGQMAMRLVEHAIVLEPLGRHVMKGLPDGEDVFRVVAHRRSGARFHRALAHGLGPYVGRSAEWDALRSCARRAQAGAVVAVVVEGEAGIGKSRLVWEVAGTLEAEGWLLVRAEAVSYGRDLPFHLVASVVRACLELDGQADPAQAGAHARARVEALLGNRAHAAATLLSLLDLPLDDEAGWWEGQDPQQRRNILRDSVAALFAALARDCNVAMVIEDLHWADQESLRLVDACAASAGRLLLLVTSRAGAELDWRHTAMSTIPLRPLDPGDMAILVRKAFPGRFDTLIVDELIERSGGNPFYLEEIARAAAEATARLGQGGPGIVPLSIQDVLAARIDRLVPADKHVLRAAAALGNRFPLSYLEAMVSARLSIPLAASLARLREAKLLEAQTDTEETFSHSLVREVAYEALPGQRRRSLHATITHIIRDQNPGRLAENAETLAYHAGMAELWDELAIHARQAGVRAAGRSAYQDASTFFQRAIQAEERLEPDPDSLRRRIDLRFQLRNALFPTKGISGCLGHSQDAERLAIQLGDRGRTGWATAFHARDLTLCGRPGAALEVAERALALSEGDEELVVMTSCYQALAAYSRGDFAASARTLRTLVSQIEAGDRMRRFRMPAPAAVFLRGWLSWALARMGEAEEADAVTAGQLLLASETTQPLCLMFAKLSRGFVLAFSGQVNEAESLLRDSLALCDQWEFSAWRTNVASCLGHVLSRTGQCEEGIGLLLEAVALTRASGILVSHANELAWLGAAYLVHGDVVQARQLAAEAIEVAVRHEERGNEAFAQSVLADALVAAGSGGVDVRAAFSAALALAADCNMVPLAGHCRRMLDRPCVPAETHLQVTRLHRSKRMDPIDVHAWYRFDGRVTTSGQPTEAQLREIADLGVRHVINLALHTHERALPDERASVEKLGMTYTHIPVEFGSPTEADFTAFCDAMETRAGDVVHVHCIMNWRVSSFMYRYRREVLGIPEADARGDLQTVWEPEGPWIDFTRDPATRMP